MLRGQRASLPRVACLPSSYPHQVVAFLLKARVHAVSRSSSLRKNIACGAESPHISREGGRLPQTRGRSGCPKILQPFCSSSCTQRTPAGLPFGMPGMGELIDGAMQQAPQPGRQLTGWCGEDMRQVYYPSLDWSHPRVYIS
jgi:hypothetical protein